MENLPRYYDEAQATLSFRNSNPCPLRIHDPLTCPYSRHVLDHNRISGWRYECQRLQAPCPAYKQAATREELARKMFANLKGQR